LPTLTVLIDLPAEVGRTRRGGVHDRLESEADHFHSAVRQHFLTLAQADADRYLIVDGEQRAEQIHQLVRARVAAIPEVAR
jgi:dTMP kinase